MLKKSLLIVTFLVFTILGTNAFGQDIETRVSYLERKILDLERRIEELEQLLKQSKSEERPSFELGDVSKLWRSLRIGMTMGEVRKLLGEPHRIDASQVLGESWWYRYEYKSGNIRFDSHGRIKAWSEP